MAEPVTIKLAESPGKPAMLALLDEVRAEIESGKCIHLLMVPIFAKRRFDIRASGDLSMATLAGMLGSAWLAATEALKGE